MTVIIHNQPEYFFTLYLENLFTANLIKRVAICTNSNRSPLVTNDPQYSYIYTGTSQAVSVSKTLDENPTEFNDIPISAIPPNVILSRQLTGTPFRLTMTTFNGNDPSEYIISVGIVGQISQTMTKVKLELVSDTERLKTDERYKTSFSCMNTLGQGKCTVDPQPIVLNCFNILSNDTFVTNFGGVLEAKKEYEVIVGTGRYIVNKQGSSGGNLKIIGYLQGVPQKLTLQSHCNQTLSNCIAAYNNIAQFNGSVLLISDSINVSL